MEEERSEQEAAEREGEEEESSFIDDQRRDESILTIDGSNPLFIRPDEEGETSESYNNPLKEIVVRDTKQFIKDVFGISISEDDELYDELIVVRDGSNRISGAKYKGTKIIVMNRKTKALEYSTNSRYAKRIGEFKELLMRAHKEYQKTPAALVGEHTGVDVTQDTMNDIINNVSDEIDSRVNSKVEDITTNTEITENELRELRGLLDPKGSSVAAKLEALKVESNNWKKKAEEEGDTRKGKLYEAIADIADLKADEMRLRLNQKPKRS